MGTNFYGIINNSGPDVSVHLGKRSAGWEFCHRGARGEIETRRQWIDRLLTFNRIENEYHDEVDIEEMVHISTVGCPIEGRPLLKDDEHSEHTTREAVRFSRDNGWRDGEGYYFLDADFS